MLNSMHNLTPKSVNSVITDCKSRASTQGMFSKQQLNNGSRNSSRLYINILLRLLICNFED